LHEAGQDIAQNANGAGVDFAVEKGRHASFGANDIGNFDQLCLTANRDGDGVIGRIIILLGDLNLCGLKSARFAGALKNRD